MDLQLQLMQIALKDCRSGRLSVREFCRQVQISPTCFYALLAGTQRGRIDTLTRIADLCGVQICLHSLVPA